MAVDDGLEKKAQHLLVTSKSAMTPSSTGGRAEDAVGRAAEHAFRFEPMPLTCPLPFDRDNGGSFQTRSLRRGLDESCRGARSTADFRSPGSMHPF